MIKKDENGILHGNVSIDFDAKHNVKKTNKRKSNFTKGANSQLNSENFVEHLNKMDYEPIDDPKKLIKKGEKPVRVGNLLGLEQVGQCVFIEYENDMILIDAGMEFAAEDELGADYIVPDITYVKNNLKKLKGVILTHGHLDHIGALRDLLPELGYPVLYTTPLTLGIVKKTFDDPKEANKIRYKIIDPDVDLLKLGTFTIEFIRVNHNIPETLALAIHTPKGLIFNSADFKIDHTPAIDKPADLGKIGRIGMEGVKLYIGDSLGADRTGWSVSEKNIGENLDELIKNIKSRMIIATFASNVGRIIQIIQSAIRYNKVVFLSGRSMVNNVEICQQLGYIKIPDGYIRKLSSEVDDLPDDRVLVLSTGAQGEEFAGLTRMARGEHQFLTLRKGDTILMSASTIPGNESSVKKMIDALVVQDINLITNDEIDVHASGHGYAEDHKLFLTLLKPEFFLPFYMPAAERYSHKKLATYMGIPDERILMPNMNGSIVEIYDDVVTVGKDKLKLDTVLVDGKGKGHLSGEYVVKARHIMAQNGIVALIFKVDTNTKDLVGNIQIESRGFVYSSEVKNIHTQIVDFARSKYNSMKRKRMDVKDILKQIKLELGTHITNIIGRVPMIITMFVYINREGSKDPINKNDAIIGMTLEEQGYDE